MVPAAGSEGNNDTVRPLTPARLRHPLICVLAACLALTGCGPAPNSRWAGPASPDSSSGSAEPSPSASASASPSPSPSAAKSASPSAPPKAGTGGVPRPDHIVVAIFENHGYSQIIGGKAPYLNGLAAQGTLLTDSHGVTHPSQGNYVALFSGSTYGIHDDSCPRDIAGTGNLGSQLAGAGLSFVGYSEGMPSAGYRGCGGGDKYARKHNAWVDFTALPASVNQTFDAFPGNFASLPSVSFVAPNLCNDMHDCSVSTGDAWAQAHLGPYVTWAATHNSLLIITWDEDENPGGDPASGGHIPTIFVGAHVVPGGRYGGAVDHYRVLRTIEAAFGLPGLGAAGSRDPITGIWR